MKAAELFRTEFGSEPEEVWKAPGRVNLIGEHTDYNAGCVLPFALPLGIEVAAARRDDDRLRVRSAAHPYDPVDAEVGTLNAPPPTVQGWGAYVAGVLWAFRQARLPVGGFDLAVDGDLPSGAGLSSSAALTCATALAVDSLLELGQPRFDTSGHDLVAIAQSAESQFVGMPCGIMDQMASLLGEEGHALFVDCDGYKTEQIPLDLAGEGLTLLVIDTLAPHVLVDGEYEIRRRICHKAAKTLGIEVLREIDPANLKQALDRLKTRKARPRVRHFVTENARALETAELLRAGRIRDIGPLLTASHVSLRDDYEVSCPELDTAVDAALAAGALGARLTGGGFGGCAIALVEHDSSTEVEKAVTEAFDSKRFTPPTIFSTAPSAGARRLLP